MNSVRGRVILKKDWIRGTRRMLNEYSPTEFKLSHNLYLCGIRCERNYPVELLSGHHVFIDFFFPKANLAVEVDGEEHKKWKDEHRSKSVISVMPGLEFRRFKNKEVLADPLAVVEWIAKRIGVRFDPPIRTWADEI